MRRDLKMKDLLTSDVLILRAHAVRHRERDVAELCDECLDNKASDARWRDVLRAVNAHRRRTS